MRTKQTNCLYSICDSVKYDHLSKSYQYCNASSSFEVEPSIYQLFIRHDRWVQAMKDEIKALEDNRT